MIQDQQNRSYFNLFDRSRSVFNPTSHQDTDSNLHSFDKLSQYPPGSAFKVKNDSRILSLVGVLKDGNVLLFDNDTQTLEWYERECIEEI